MGRNAGYHSETWELEWSPKLYKFRCGLKYETWGKNYQYYRYAWLDITCWVQRFYVWHFRKSISVMAQYYLQKVICCLWNGILYAIDYCCWARLISISIKLNIESLPGSFHMRNGYLLSSFKAWFALMCTPNDCRKRLKSMQCIDHELGYTLNRNNLQSLFCSNHLRTQLIDVCVTFWFLNIYSEALNQTELSQLSVPLIPPTQKLVYVMWGVCRSKNRHSKDIGLCAQNVLTNLGS